MEETYWECGYTKADGTYFVELEPGAYKVEFWPRWSGQNLALQFYNDKGRWNEADAVVVGPGERTGGIDAELELSEWFGEPFEEDDGFVAQF